MNSSEGDFQVPMAQTLASLMDSHLSIKSNKPGMAVDKENKVINTNPLNNMSLDGCSSTDFNSGNYGRSFIRIQKPVSHEKDFLISSVSIFKVKMNNMS